MDCPKDNSLGIVQKYQKIDNRIRCIENQYNIGAALSRNKGMRCAKAPYPCFWDADDVFEADLFGKSRSIC